MRVLIGTPIHISKDHLMEKWLENVSDLKYPADLLMVDSSPNLDYVEKVKGYCAKYGIHPVRSMAFESDIESNVDIDLSTPPKHEYQTSNGARNYKIEHLEINQEQGADERNGRSKEIIRQEILSHDYEAWFAWECDQIIPPDALDKLVGIMKEMKEGNFTMIHFNSLAREIPAVPDANLGCSLIKRECLEKYGFLLEYPNMTNCWHQTEAWFKSQVLKGGGGYAEVYGVITQAST